MRHWDSETGHISSGGSRDDSIISGSGEEGIGEGDLRFATGRDALDAAFQANGFRRPGASELRIRDQAGIYRAFYYLKSARGVLVFHAFVKKGRATPLPEMNMGRKRLKELLNEEN